MELDIINPVTLGRLDVNGQLFFSKANTKLIAEKIWVKGKLTAGDTTTPFVDNLIIELTGSRTSSPLTLDNGKVVGNKVIAVTGTLSLYGKIISKPWGRLK